MRNERLRYLVRRVVERDGALAPVGERDDPEARKTSDPLGEDQVPTEDAEPLEQRPVARGSRLDPRPRARPAGGRLHQPVVGGAEVGPDPEPAPGVLDPVPEPRRARLEHLERSVRLGGLHVAPLRRRFARALDQHHGSRLREGERNLERRVVLLEHDRVGRRGRADGVADDAVGPERGVARSVEERPAVGGPGDLPRGARDRVRQQRPVPQVANADRVQPVAAGVHAERRKHVVRADGDVGELAHRTAARERVDVEHDFLGRAAGRLPAAVDRVLLAGLEPGPVQVPVVLHGRGRALGLDPPGDLREQLGLERLGRLHHCSGVRVFRLEVRPDLRVAAIAHPVVVVDANVAVRLEPLRDPRCDRRNGRGRGRRHGDRRRAWQGRRRPSGAERRQQDEGEQHLRAHHAPARPHLVVPSAAAGPRGPAPRTSLPRTTPC